MLNLNTPKGISMTSVGHAKLPLLTHPLLPTTPPKRNTIPQEAKKRLLKKFFFLNESLDSFRGWCLFTRCRHRGGSSSRGVKLEVCQLYPPPPPPPPTMGGSGEAKIGAREAEEDGSQRRSLAEQRVEVNNKTGGRGPRGASLSVFKSR